MRMIAIRSHSHFSPFLFLFLQTIMSNMAIWSLKHKEKLNPNDSSLSFFLNRSRILHPVKNNIWMQNFCTTSSATKCSHSPEYNVSTMKKTPANWTLQLPLRQKLMDETEESISLHQTSIVTEVQTLKTLQFTPYLRQDFRIAWIGFVWYGKMAHSTMSICKHQHQQHQLKSFMHLSHWSNKHSNQLHLQYYLPSSSWLSLDHKNCPNWRKVL